jgi:hypothetical protein
MRRLAIAAAVLALVAPACGGSDQDRPAAGEAPPPAALAYFPPGAAGVALVPTDLDGAQLRRFAKLVEPSLRLRDELPSWARDEGLDFARDVEPLLGGTLVAGAVPGDILVALETPDGERLARTAERIIGLARRGSREHRGATVYREGVAVDGPTVLLAGDERTLVQAIDRQRDGGGSTPRRSSASSARTRRRTRWCG